VNRTQSNYKVALANGKLCLSFEQMEVIHKEFYSSTGSKKDGLNWNKE